MTSVQKPSQIRTPSAAAKMQLLPAAQLPADVLMGLQLMVVSSQTGTVRAVISLNVEMLQNIPGGRLLLSEPGL